MQARGVFEDDFFGASNLDSGGYESVQMMKERMNTFLATSGLKVSSIETAFIDGSITKMNAGRYNVRDGGKSEWVYQTLRVWYNALDPENLQPSVIEAVHDQNQLSAKTVKEAKEGCVVM